MGRDTLIGWCDSTINGSSGCDGCELWNGEVRTCYAGTLQTARLSKSMPSLYSANFAEVRMIPGRFAQAASWSDLRGTDRPDKPWLNGMPRCIFVGDMGDFLSKAVTDEFLEREMLGAITSKQGQRHFWMLLTKRPLRLAMLSKKWGGLPDNVMAMTTVTSQKTADVRLPHLMRVQCRWRGVSMEPLLEAVEIRPFLYLGERTRMCPVCAFATNRSRETLCPNDGTPLGPDVALDWVIVGGESGSDARPMHPAWPRSLREQCHPRKVPLFFKQWGIWQPQETWSYTQTPQVAIDATGKQVPHDVAPQDVGGQRFIYTGKKGTDRLLDGVQHDGFPNLGA